MPPCDREDNRRRDGDPCRISLRLIYLQETEKLHEIRRDDHQDKYLVKWYNKHVKRVTGDGCPHNCYRSTTVTFVKWSGRFSMS